MNGTSASWNGVEGDTWSSAHAGVAAVNHAGGPAVLGSSTGNAGQFEGNVLITGSLTVNQSVTVSQSLTVDGTLTGDAAEFSANLNVGGNIGVTGDVTLSGGQDCAEDFDVADDGLEAGTVVVMTDDGSVRCCDSDYATAVVGVISGAGQFRPGITLDRRPSDATRLPVALIGKVYCKVDASRSPIKIGDLLTTSSTSGHAMRANDTTRAFGSVIGKAMGSLAQGTGLIPVLVALQ